MGPTRRMAWPVALALATQLAWMAPVASAQDDEVSPADETSEEATPAETSPPPAEENEDDPSDDAAPADAASETAPAGPPPGAPRDAVGDPRGRAGEVVPPPPRAAPQAPRRTDGPNVVNVFRDEGGFKLRVDGVDTMVLGMNWAYMPIGENYSYDFWGKSDAFIEDALESEMTMLRDMGVNAIRVYVGIPQRWITYIYENYGIYTILNHALGRYGHNVDGVWRVPTDYSHERTREVLLEEIRQLAQEYKDTPGLMMWLLGNENNYGLYWSSSEIEDLPEEDQGDARAVFLYTLFGESVDAIHAIDDNHPVAIANGDLQFIELIREHCPNLDILGSNVYRGPSSGGLFDEVSEVLDIPFVYTEFGSDAYNAREGREDDLAQAEIDLALWQEIYEHAYGHGRAQNAIGGMTFQWSDGWWKYRQEVNLDVHDETASWSNEAYQFDWAPGLNNMNEEWFGICAKGRPNERGLYRLYCRTAYYALRDAYRLDPYAPTTNIQVIREHFGRIRPIDMAANYASQQSMNRLDAVEAVRLAYLRIDFDTYTTGGRNLNDAPRAVTRFDNTQSFYFGMDLQPAPRVRANLALNILGNVAQNPINEIFYENRGIPRQFIDAEGEEVSLSSLDRIQVYRSSFSWEEDWFKLEGYFRQGQNHWGYEGDFFNLVPQTYYGVAVDQFNANVPVGITFNGRRELEGLRIAFGPELWWGANPTIIGLYHRNVGPWEIALMHQEDIAQRAAGPTSQAVPVPRDRRSTIYLSRTWGPLEVEIGGIMAGSPRVGRAFQGVEEAPEGTPSYLNSGFFVRDDEINIADTFGAKARIRLNAAPFFWYLQGSYRGLVADGGWDPTINITGWSLKESGQGNHWAVSTGAAYNIGNFQIAPNFLIQRPLEGPLPQVDDFFDPVTGTYFPGLNGRNQLTDPFWVRSNRETYGFELLIAFDPTPATWMWAWDNLRREDASFAAALDMTYRIHPTIQDSGVGVSAEGFQFAFPTSAPAQDLWDVRLQTIINFSHRARLVNTFYVGNGQGNGNDERLVYRGGMEGRFTYDRFQLDYFFRIADWGPYDYYRDFNNTFPFQGMLDASFGLTNPQWFVAAYTRFGVRGMFRALDENSARFLADPVNPGDIGTEWEVRTYVQISL